MTSRLLTDLPPVALMLIFMAIAIVLVLVVSWLFYDKFILMAQAPPQPKETDADTPAEPVIPSTYDLWSRLLGFTTLAFVFMLAFVLNTLWGNVQAAQEASQSEAADLARLTTLSLEIPNKESAQKVQQAIDEYTRSLSDAQWPLLRIADGSGAAKESIEATGALAQVIIREQSADTTSSPVWRSIESTLSDIGEDSADRLGQLPASSVPLRVWTVILLGLSMLLMTTAFLPTRVKPYRLAISIMAALTSLLIFVMVNASNPYAHHVTPPEILQSSTVGSQ